MVFNQKRKKLLFCFQLFGSQNGYPLGSPWGLPGLPGVSPWGLPGGPLGVSLSTWLPDVSQMPPSCFLDASQMLPRWLQDDSQMLPDVSRCPPDDSQMIPPVVSICFHMPPRCSPDASRCLPDAFSMMTSLACSMMCS